MIKVLSDCINPIRNRDSILFFFCLNGHMQVRVSATVVWVSQQFDFLC